MIEYTVKVRDNGDKQWYYQGQLHREDGPAAEYADGEKKWYCHGKLHRENGPAIEYADGEKKWYCNGKFHREDGPAIECIDGTKEWYLHGKRVTEQEVLGPKEITIEGVTYTIVRKTN